MGKSSNSRSNETSPDLQPFPSAQINRSCSCQSLVSGMTPKRNLKQSLGSPFSEIDFRYLPSREIFCRTALTSIRAKITRHLSSSIATVKLALLLLVLRAKRNRNHKDRLFPFSTMSFLNLFAARAGSAGFQRPNNSVPVRNWTIWCAVSTFLASVFAVVAPSSKFTRTVKHFQTNFKKFGNFA